MRVDRLTLKNFTVFADAAFEFSPGLNVIIGANATGKSHLLKLLYSIARPIGTMGPIVVANPDWATDEVLGEPILQAISKAFRPERADPWRNSLIRRGVDHAEFVAHGDFGAVAFHLVGEDFMTEAREFVSPQGIAVFVPAAEVLSMYPGFVAAYERRELSFDVTFRDLCVDLSANPLRIIVPDALADVAAELDNAVGGKTVLNGGRFSISLAPDWLLEAPMLAEGLRKLASVAHLIRNGSLTENTALFWDEPEANMNPKLIPIVARTLLALAGAGVQVFIATHDYLLTNELSIAAEYGTPEAKAARPRFFCLARPEPHEPVTVQSGDTMADLGSNPILEEFAAHYDRNQKLFAQAGPEN